MKTFRIAGITALVCTLSPPLFADEAKTNGAELFNYHGCINCHGAEARNPVSKVVPNLAGKPADELYQQAKKILGGGGSTEEAKIMHAAFYSPAQCDAPPTDEEIQAITVWLSTL